MKLITLAFCGTLLMAGSSFGQIGETLPQCIAKYGPVVEKQPREWHKFESTPHHLEIHFYKGKADAVQFLNWAGGPKPFTNSEIENLLKQTSTPHSEFFDANPDPTIFAAK